jgi:hypothetical protein
MYRRLTLSISRIILCACFMASPPQARGDSLAPLPEVLSNNAVASLHLGGKTYIASFAGISQGLSHADIHARTFVLRSDQDEWRQAPDVPGGAGRLASVAIPVGELMYVFGGYTVDTDGAETSTPWVHAFDPVAMEFAELAPMPVPVDDAVAVSYQDRYIYVVSGWHDFGNVNLVQVFDTETNRWAQATPLPGNALFGHAGGIAGNQMLYCDGVAVQAQSSGPREFVASAECFTGTIDTDNFRRIDWRPIDPHPGKPRYRMAATGIESAGTIVFVGGSDNPYNFNGIGYNGIPSEPCSSILSFDLHDRLWTEIAGDQTASMDHRGLIYADSEWYTVGGMLSRQAVTAKVLSHNVHPDK